MPHARENVGRWCGSFHSLPTDDAIWRAKEDKHATIAGLGCELGAAGHFSSTGAAGEQGR
jgi:hypothetical protein